MDDARDTAVVGTYLSRDQAERARDHLREEGLDDVAIIEPVDDDAWQVRVPAEHREEALGQLQRVHQWIMTTHP